MVIKFLKSKIKLVSGLILLILLLIPMTSNAIIYYQSAKGGVINKIDTERFDQCKNVIYRTAAKSELSRKHKKRLLSALIKGDTVNDLVVAVKKLKINPEFCSYGSDAEHFN